MSLPFKTYIVSAASGTGKTTLDRRLVAEIPELELSVSHTTRGIRPGEVDGDHYHFVSDEEFSYLIANHQMLEWAAVFNHRYGTSLGELARINSKGHAALLEIDVQGWAQARRKLTSACSIFLLPPSIETLWERLRKRGTDSLEKCHQRFLTARQELAQAPLYEHFVVNDTVERSFQELKGFIVHQAPLQLTTAQGVALCQQLTRDFDSLNRQGQLPR